MMRRDSEREDEMRVHGSEGMKVQRGEEKRGKKKEERREEEKEERRARVEAENQIARIGDRIIKVWSPGRYRQVNVKSQAGRVQVEEEAELIGEDQSAGLGSSKVGDWVQGKRIGMVWNRHEGEGF